MWLKNTKETIVIRIRTSFYMFFLYGNPKDQKVSFSDSSDYITNSGTHW